MLDGQEQGARLRLGGKIHRGIPLAAGGARPGWPLYVRSRGRLAGRHVLYLSAGSRTRGPPGTSGRGAH